MEINVKQYNLIAAATGKMSEKVTLAEMGTLGEGVTFREILAFITQKYGRN